MASENFKQMLVNALKGLNPSEFTRFRAEARRRVDENTNLAFYVAGGIASKGEEYTEITDLLVSTFTMDGALQEASQILKKIGCTEVAERVNRASGLYDMPVFDRGGRHLVDDYKDVFNPFSAILQLRELRNSRPKPNMRLAYPIRSARVRDLMSAGSDWSKLEPEVTCEDPPIYSLQSEAGQFECVVSGLRWVCEERIRFKYQFGSWEEHMERLESLHYIPGGPLLDITVIDGKFDAVYLPHWICINDHPIIIGRFKVLHMDSCGDVVEEVSEVTPSHVRLSNTVFSPRGVLMRAGLPVKMKCKTLIYKTNKAFLTLHVYLIPRDPKLQQTIENKELSYGHKMIQKPYPEKSLKMRNRFTLTVKVGAAEVYPKTLELVYESSDPNFFEVFIDNPVSDFQLILRHSSNEEWNCIIRKDDYQNTGDFQLMFEADLARVRPKLVPRVSMELINQLLDDLLEDGVMNDGERESILAENHSRADRARCLIDMVKNKGREASRKMFNHLHHRDPTLSSELGLPSGLPV